MSLITMDIPPQLVTGFDLPPGWIAFAPTGPVSQSDPFFSDGYMLDGSGIPSPWDPLAPMTYVAFRTSATEAANDALPSGFDPALSSLNPNLVFTVHISNDIEEVPLRVWAGGETQTVLGPSAVPEPAGVWLWAAGLGWLGRLRRRKRG